MSGRLTALHGSMSDRYREWLALAEAAYDASEQEASPQDLIAYYLERIEIVASHWASITGFFATESNRVNVGDRDLIAYIEVCVQRVEAAGGTNAMADPCVGLWSSFTRAIAAIKGWEGDSGKAVHVVNIIYVCSLVMRRAYRPSPPWEPDTREHVIEMWASSLPFPLDTKIALRDQAQVVARNLRWLHETLATAPA